MRSVSIAFGWWHRAHEAQHAFRQRPRGSELRLQLAQLGPVWQPAVPQQIADFLERGVLGEIVDVVAAIGEHAALAIQITNGRRRDDDVFKPCLGGSSMATTWMITLPVASRQSEVVRRKSVEVASQNRRA